MLFKRLLPFLNIIEIRAGETSYSFISYKMTRDRYEGVLDAIFATIDGKVKKAEEYS